VNRKFNSTSEIRFICILATARTGSNLVFSLLKHHKKLNLKWELFHPKWVGALTTADGHALGEEAQGDLGDNKRLCIWRAAHASQTLETLYKSGGERPLVFKIFPSHLDRNLLREELFGRTDIGYIVLRRRPIESFISITKAKAIKTFKRADTTAIRPELDVNSFVKWATRARNWDDWLRVELAAKKRRYAELSYEHDVGLADSREALSRIVNAIAQVGLTSITMKKSPRSAIKRQDHEARYQDRVKNWPEFEATLMRDEAHAQLLEWAQKAT
jgi:LPS sulfotransferase NodH